jgi:hypothetical protein
MTQLSENQFEQAFTELLQDEFLEEVGKDRYLVRSKELCNKYRNFVVELQSRLVGWVTGWREQENVESELNHFFLEDKLLYDFSEKQWNKLKWRYW